jgi:4-amino-4-deoxy-L-arabinose transferase-like glycosyltransferase
MVLRIAAFVAVWTLYFAIIEYTSSIHNDMAEAYAWGREFQLGYNQHPPFWAWVCGAWFLIFPRANWAFAALSMLNAGLGLLGAWTLIGRFVQGDRRVAATALLALTPFYSFLAYKFNANSIFLSLWPWTLYAFVGALRARGLGATLLFGVMTGLCLDSKYYALTLVATCGVAALASGERKRYFGSLSPYLSAAVALAFWAPHLIWLAETGAPPIRYLARVSGRGFGETAAFAATALAGSLAQQALALGVVAACALANSPALGKPGGSPLPLWERLRVRGGLILKARWMGPSLIKGEGVVRENLRLVAILALAPPLLSVVAALALRTKLSSNMLIGVFPLTPLLAIELWRPDPARLRFWTLRGATALSVGALALSPIIAVGKAWWGRDSEDFEPRREAALAATDVWRRTTSAPLAFVAGSFRYDNAAVFYSPEHPSAFVDFDTFGNRWATPEALAARGLLTICRADDATCLSKTESYATPQTKRETMTLAHVAYGRARKPVNFVIAAIPPR